jgi:hypothetical protein
MAISGAYVMSRANHLPIFVDANLAPASTTKTYDILSSSGLTLQPYTVPFYTNRIDAATGIIQVGYSDVNSWYNSLVISLKRAMRHGLEFTANYTFSGAWDNGQVIGASGTFAGSDIAVDPRSRTLEYAPSDLDQRSRFVANAMWMPTISKLPNKTVATIVNGWAISSILTLSTGRPQQANLSGTPSPLDGGLTAGDASNASVTAGRAGWLQRNPIYGPDFNVLDLRLAREFKFTERMKLALMGEAFNILNHTNIATVNTTAYNYAAPGSGLCAGHTNACMVPSPTWLAPTSTSSLIWGPRQLQISGRITF